MGITCASQNNSNKIKDDILKMLETNQNKLDNSKYEEEGCYFSFTPEIYSNYTESKRHKTKFQFLEIKEKVEVKIRELSNSQSEKIKTAIEERTVKIFYLLSSHGKKFHTIKESVVFKLNYEIIENKKSIIKAETKEESHLIFDSIFSRTQNTMANSGDDFKFSGVTLNMVIFNNDNIFTLNLGDSRCFLFQSYGNSRKKEIIQLSLDQVLHRKQEQERLTKNVALTNLETQDSNSRVYPFKGSLVNNKFLLTRTLGDIESHNFGVSCLPEITVKKREEVDKFIFVGNHSLFQVLNNIEITELVNSHYRNFKREKKTIITKILEIAMEKYKLLNKDKKINKKLTTIKTRITNNNNVNNNNNISVSGFGRNNKIDSNTNSMVNETYFNKEIEIPELSAFIIFMQ